MIISVILPNKLSLYTVPKGSLGWPLPRFPRLESPIDLIHDGPRKSAVHHAN